MLRGSLPYGPLKTCMYDSPFHEKSTPLIRWANSPHRKGLFSGWGGMWQSVVTYL